MAQGEERPSASGGGDDENGKYPIGFSFMPTTEELVDFYLLPRLLDEPTVPNEFVIEADAYEDEPEILTEKYKERGVDDTCWYFLSKRNRKYPGGDRPVRRTVDKRGRWKPSTGQSKPPEEDNATTSHSSKAKKKQATAAAYSENTLAYYVGSTRDETKTKWLMHELVVPETPGNGFVRGKSAAAAETSDVMLLNKYVVCKIYKSPLKKWKEIDEAPAPAAPAEVSTSSQPSVPAPAPSSSSSPPPAKRPAVVRPAAKGGHTGAPNKGVSVSQTALFPGGGGSVRTPVAGVGAAGLPALMRWPPACNSMQGPVQTQQPPSVYGYGNRALGTPNANAHGGQAAPGRQGPPVLRLRPPHRAAATTAPNFQGPTMMMRPPNLAAGGQPARLPSPRQQQQPPPLTETEEAYRNGVYMRLIAEMKLQKAEQESAARAGQQRISQTPSAKPACFHDEGGNRPGGVEAMVPPAQFPAPHGSRSNNLAQGPQRQQSGSAAATPAAVEKAPAAENVSSNKQSVPPGASANEGSCKGGLQIPQTTLFCRFWRQIGPL